MKFSIHINQKQALELGIANINQAVIFDLLTGLSTWAKPEIIDGEVFYWVSRQRIALELPLLNLKPDTIYRHLKALNELDLIQYRKLGRKDCVKITEKGKKYYVGNRSEFSDLPMSEIDPSLDKNSETDPSKLGNKSESNSEINPTDQTTNKQISLLDQLKADYPNLNIDAFAELEQHRKNIKHPLNNLSRQKLINKLLPYTQAEQKAAIDLSIENDWRGVFPEKNKSGSVGEQRNAAHQTFEQREADERERQENIKRLQQEAAQQQDKSPVKRQGPARPLRDILKEARQGSSTQ